jgi:hypothetical protein
MNRSSIRVILASALGALALAVTVAYAASTEVVTNEDIERGQFTNTPGSQPPPQQTSKSWYQIERRSVGGAYGTGIIDTALGAPAGGGVGSYHTQTTDGGSKVSLFNMDAYNGKPLGDLQDLSYYTYRNAGTGDQLPALNIWLDTNNNGLLERGIDPVLVYEPVYNNTNQAIVSGQWQKWETFAGNWWLAESPLPGMCTGAAYSCMKTLAEIVAAYPGLTIGGIGINQGSGNNGLDAATDLLTVKYAGDEVTYNFEPYRVAGSNEDCAKNGYKSVKDSNGQPFKNQGQCVSFVNSNRGGNK